MIFIKNEITAIFGTVLRYVKSLGGEDWYTSEIQKCIGKSPVLKHTGIKINKKHKTETISL